ncbi:MULTISPECIES: quinone oxidoreductase family protein [Streptomyces]|uniref:quinone oxidoreductase family protein n=1 Tax=Streptomyces TaxID=1883 RepID=UPI0005197E2C|nr:MULTISPECIES: zinc-binding dehydrogenase [Streptomyces]
MKAVIATSSGDPAIADAPEPSPAPGQVRVDVEAAGVGYVDVMALRGEYPAFPGAGAVPGVEAVGQVTAVGPDVSEGLVGQRVLALLPGFGGFAETAVADAELVFPVPLGAQAADVVAIGVNALVAELALHRVGAAVGERVLVRGAGGGIGMLATQIARAQGAEVTAVTSSAERGERLRALGASHILDRTKASTLPGAAYDIVVDTVAGPELGKHLELLRPNGRYVICGAAGGLPDTESFAPLLRNFHTSPSLYAFSLNSVAPEDMQGSWKRVMALLDEGRVSAVVDRGFALAEAEDALRRVAAGKAFGKVVLLPR